MTGAESKDISSWANELAWGEGSDQTFDTDDLRSIPGFVELEVPLVAPEDLEVKPEPAQGWD